MEFNSRYKNKSTHIDTWFQQRSQYYTMGKKRDFVCLLNIECGEVRSFLSEATSKDLQEDSQGNSSVSLEPNAGWTHTPSSIVSESGHVDLGSSVGIFESPPSWCQCPEIFALVFLFSILIFFVYFVMLRIELKSLYTVGKGLTTKLHLYPIFFFLLWNRLSLICPG